MANEIKLAIEQICEEKGLSFDIVLATIEQALAAAYRKDFATKDHHIRTKFDINTGKIDVFEVKEVVEDMEFDEEGNVVQPAEPELNELGKPIVKRFNPVYQIMLKDAKKIDKTLEIGGEVITPLEIPGEFGRVAALTAKQVVIQKLRESERESVFEQYKDKERTIVIAQVLRQDGRNIILELGKHSAILPYEEQLPRERYAQGSRFKFYLLRVESGPRGVSIILSHRHPDLVKELFTAEVPEIASGLVEIKGVAREAGARTKIAVASTDPKIDALGSCVGQGGTRVQTIINELGGEKIDIVSYSNDMAVFITSALSPADLIDIKLFPEQKTANVLVSNDQLSLAIGKGGQNVRLASRLVGWRINVLSENESEYMTDPNAGRSQDGASFDQTTDFSNDETVIMKDVSETKQNESQESVIEETKKESSEETVSDSETNTDSDNK